MRLLLLASVLCVGGCSTQYTSYVGPIDPVLAPQVASDMADFVSQRINPRDGSIQVEQPAGDTSIGPKLIETLTYSGFTIVNVGGKHRVRYAADTLGDDIVARVSVDYADGARMYRDKPLVGLAPLGPYTVTERGE